MTRSNRTASVIYWYSGTQLRPDGGGSRALAWRSALERLGYATNIVPLATREVVAGGGGVGLASRAKKALVPMPLDKDVPPGLNDSDIVVATVPATFPSCLKHVPAQRLILDWMDLWSVSSRTMGDARMSTFPGGRIQSNVWRRREKVMPDLVGANTVAGYAEYELMSRNAKRPVRWLPNPAIYQSESVMAPPSDKVRLGFIGNFNYGPNVLSLREFLTAYSDLVRRPDTEIVVAGYGSEIARSWSSSLTVLGPVDQVADFYGRVDAAVVPIEHGSGIKVKAIEALAYGVPVFGTDHVRSGLPPSMRPYVHDIGALRSSAGYDLSRPSQDLFDAAFGFDSFVETVSASIQDCSDF